MDFSDQFEKKIWDYMETWHMADRGSQIVAGVSGGADSICLLEVLCRFAECMDWQITAVHVHHGIRGSQADRDEAYVRKFCKNRNVNCKCFKYNVPEMAKELGMGEEEAGRTVRLQAFASVMDELGQKTRLALAHHKNDQAETVLFHLIRGSNIQGLAGIRPVNGVCIRPMLCMQREEIIRYLTEQGISYCTDDTNFSDAYTRNRLRLTVIPEVKAMNAGAVENISRAAGHVRQAVDFIDGEEQKAWNKYGLGEKSGEIFLPKQIKAEHIFLQKCLVYRAVSELAGSKKDLQEKHILAVLGLFKKQAGREYHLPFHVRARRVYGGIRLFLYEQRHNDEWEQLLFSAKERGAIIDELKNGGCQSGCIFLKQPGYIFKWRIFLYEKNLKIPKNNYTKWFDYDKITSAALFRTRRSGDYLVLDSSGRHKKLKKYFIDTKIPADQRDIMPLLADGSHIIWVADGRMSEEYKVHKDTRAVLELRMVKG